MSLSPHRWNGCSLLALLWLIYPIAVLSAKEGDATSKIQFKKGHVSAVPLGDCPGGKIEIRVSEKFARLYDRKAGKPIGEKLKPRRVFDQTDRLKITCWAFSPDGKFVAIGAGYVTHLRSGDNNIGDIRVWDTATGKLVSAGPEKGIGQIRQLAFSADGKTVQFTADKFEVDGP